MSALVFALGVYINRERLKRAVIAYRIYRAHVFTPPPSPGESQLRQLRADVRFYWDFSGLRVARDRRLRQLDPTLRPLVKEIGRRQAAGEGMQYSMHIYREIRWRLNFTPDIGTTRARIADLRRSLAQPGEQKLAAGQQASDGSWGRGLTVWFLKLYYSVEDGLHSGTEPRYPLSFLDRINSPEKLTAQLDSVLHDDFTKTGAFNREELDQTFSALARLLFGNKRTGYAFHPQLRDALGESVERLAEPCDRLLGPVDSGSTGEDLENGRHGDDVSRCFGPSRPSAASGPDSVACAAARRRRVSRRHPIQRPLRESSELGCGENFPIRLAGPGCRNPAEGSNRDLPYARLVLGQVLPAGRLFPGE